MWKRWKKLEDKLRLNRTTTRTEVLVVLGLVIVSRLVMGV